MFRRLDLIAIAAVGSVLLGPSSTPAPAAGLPRGEAKAEGFDPDRLGRIRALLQEAVERRQIAGGLALVARHGKVVELATAGAADPGKPLADSTLFRIASMTKPITSAAVLLLADEGKLRLDDPVSKYIPEFRAPRVLVRAADDAKPGAGAGPPATEPAARPITIHDLLTHTSGLTYGFLDRPVLGRLYADARVSDGLAETPGTIGENAVRLARLPLLNQPGKAWEYGLSTDVLGRVVEVASGARFGTFLEDRIFARLGMDDTSFVVPKAKRDRLAGLYVPGQGGKVHRVGEGPVLFGALVFSATYPVWDDSRYESGGAGLVSTAGDYARFLQMLLNRGELEGTRLLKPATVDLMTTDHIAPLKVGFSGHGDGFGYGFGVLTERGRTADVANVGTYSWGGIFYTYFWADPKRDLIGILMTQVYPSDHLKLRERFKALTYEALSAPR